MSLENIFDMVKADRYTQDGRDELIKAQEAEVEDRRYNIGEISEKTGLQKTAEGWVEPKKGKRPAGGKKETQEPGKGNSFPAEKKNSGKAKAPAKERESNTATKEKKIGPFSIKYTQSKINPDAIYADVEGNRITLTKVLDGRVLVAIRNANTSSGSKNYFSDYASSELEARKMASKEIQRINKEFPAEINFQEINWKRRPVSSNTEVFHGYDNGNDISVWKNEITGKWGFSVREEHGDKFIDGEASSREEAMKTGKKHSDEHKHSGARPLIIPSEYAFSFPNKPWNNNDFYHSTPRNKKSKTTGDSAPRVLTGDCKVRVKRG